jgi:hypothetical protein
MTTGLTHTQRATLARAASWKSAERMTPRFTRLPPDLDAAVDKAVALVPGLDRSTLMRVALAEYIGFNYAPDIAPAPATRPTQRRARGLVPA